jgi:hypothetical protein
MNIFITTNMQICKSMIGQFSLTKRVETFTMDDASCSLSMKQNTTIVMMIPRDRQIIPTT